MLPEWVLRDDNVIADLASKNVDRDNFMLQIFCGGPILLPDLVPFVQDSCQGLIDVGQILVPKVLMLVHLDGILRIIGYSHLQNSSQECYNIWLFQKQKGL